MNFVIRALALVATSASISGCSGLTQVQDSLGKFDQSAHTAATTQMAFFTNVQTQDCLIQYYLGAADWATGTKSTFDLTGSCTPTSITSAQLDARQHLLDAVTLYADKLQALASSDSDKTLSTNAQGLATQLNGLATSHGLSTADASIAADVEAGIVAITEMALDQKRFSEVKAAAANMQPYLEKVIAAIEAENTSFVAVVQGQQGQLEGKLRQLLVTPPVPGPATKFATLLQARQIVQSSDPFVTAALSSPAGTPPVDAAKLNAALDGIVKANKAIATSGSGGIVAEVNDLVARVQAAQATQTAITKK